MDRSLLMSKIRSKDTKPEMIVRKFVWDAGFRYRLHLKRLPGTPDLVFQSKKKVLFINGCFWHGHKCKIDKLPKSNTEFWKQKIFRNKKRDIQNKKKLTRLGWKYLILWECELKRPNVLKKILDFLED